MTKPDDPVHPEMDHTTNVGLTIREWLAGQAVQGLADTYVQCSHYRPEWAAEAADKAVCLADALIARLNQPATARPDPDAMIDLSDMEE